VGAEKARVSVEPVLVGQVEAARQREEAARVLEVEEEHKSDICKRSMLIVLDTSHKIWIVKKIGFTPDRC
jgi:hypothetical protein